MDNSNRLFQQNNQNTDIIRHKAEKYHYKIQIFLKNNYVSKGLQIPEGYAEYMKPFNG